MSNYLELNTSYMKEICQSGEGRIYEFAPELTHPDIPLEDSLTLDSSSGRVLNVYKTQVGSGGKVEFVFFKKDPEHRIYAIKQSHCHEEQKKNLDFSLHLKHPSVMKIHGLCIKTVQGKPTSYLVMPYYEETEVRSTQAKLQALTTLKNSLIYLAKEQVLPYDSIRRKNMRFTKDGVVFLDYDNWEKGISFSHMYEEFISIAQSLQLFPKHRFPLGFLDAQAFVNGMSKALGECEEGLKRQTPPKRQITPLKESSSPIVPIHVGVVIAVIALAYFLYTNLS